LRERSAARAGGNPARMRRDWQHPAGICGHHLGGKLKAKYVIHAASMGLGSLTTAETLRKLHGACAAACGGARTENDCVPGCRHGDRGIPMKNARKIMLQEAAEHLRMGVRWKPFILCCLTNRLRGFSSAPGRGCGIRDSSRRCNLKRKDQLPRPSVFWQKRCKSLKAKRSIGDYATAWSTRGAPLPYVFASVDSKGGLKCFI